jgi:hypothetical protein
MRNPVSGVLNVVLLVDMSILVFIAKQLVVEIKDELGANF